MQKRCIPLLIVIGVIVLSGIIGFAMNLRNQSFQPVTHSLSPTPRAGIPSRAQYNFPTDVPTEDDLTSYSIDELKKNTIIMTKFYVPLETPLDTEILFRQMQKTVKSFPGYRYERMNFEISSPYYSYDSGYDIRIEGRGYIDNREDRYSIGFKLVDEKLTHLSSGVSRFAIPKSVQKHIENIVTQHPQYQILKAVNPQSKLTIGQWYLPNDQFSSHPEVPRPANNFISLSVGTPCEGMGFGCLNDRFSAFYDLETGQIITSQCPQVSCKASCKKEYPPPEAADYGFSCTNNLLCCIPIPL